MIIQINKYKYGYHIASLAKTEETKVEMVKKGYSVVMFVNRQLIFYPEKWIVDLSKDENEKFEQLVEYTILEFSKGAFVSFNPCDEDNTLFITNRCNSNCVMCPVGEGIRKGAEIARIDKLIKIIHQIPSDTRHITITGGEPFLLGRDIFRMFKELREYLNDVEFLLLTNGRALANKDFFDALMDSVPDNFRIAIPIHGFNSETHDSITQVKGSFYQTCLGIRRLIGTSIKIEIRMVVSKLNYTFLNDIAEMIIKTFPRLYTVKFVGLEMLGNAWVNKEQVWIDYKQSFSYMKMAIRILVMNGYDVGIYNYPLCCVDQAFWPICEKSISGYKIRYLDECDQCKEKDICGGMFDGTVNLMKGNIEPII